MVVLFAAAVGCGGTSSATKSSEGTEVQAKGKGSSDKGGASLEKFGSVPPPSVTK